MQEIKKLLNAEVSKSLSLIESCDWENVHLYADYMAQTFYYVKHSTRLLALSASRISYEEQSIHTRFIKHLGEESNHERLALMDVKNLQFEIGDFSELVSTKLFYEPQYFKIEHISPLCIMGYIIYLEVMAQKFCPPMTEMISAYHGGKTANFLRVHGEEDPEHVEQAMILLKSLDPKSLTLICENIVQSAFSFNQMISELKEKWNVKQIKKAA